MRKIQFIELNGLASAISRIKMALCFKVNSLCRFFHKIYYVLHGSSIRNEQKSKLFQIYPNGYYKRKLIEVSKLNRKSAVDHSFK